MTNLYGRFFRKLGINKKNGTFPKKPVWPFLRFPTYPFIGSRYPKNKDYRVLFIGLDIGRDEDTGGGIIGFNKKRMLVEDREKHNPHDSGMGVAAISLLRKFENNRRGKIFKGKTYKDTLKLAREFKPDFNPFSYIAMTNCYKFVTIKRKSRLGSQDRKHILIDAELNLLKEALV